MSDLNQNTLTQITNLIKTPDIVNNFSLTNIDTKNKVLIMRTIRAALKDLDNYMMISCDTRLLHWLLQGPRKAHWNNASLGSHLSFIRKPNVHNRGLNYCWNWFYSGIYND